VPTRARGGVDRVSFLFELLRYAGWELHVRDGETASIRATRAQVEVEATGASLSEAASTAFVRAMRSGQRRSRRSLSGGSAAREVPHRSAS
jgi:hypothetical protein